ncbi:hypothetical protein ILYODFUR_034726 [Ilyodon furcidens]|uniref:Uncharacterized protein n=1 Tax=Ilyodon furcidens TaxID=33524 RepID=A0ABV0TFF6_9TELE
MFSQVLSPAPSLPSASADDLENKFSVNIVEPKFCLEPKSRHGEMLLQVELRKLSESLWRKTKLQVHFDFCKESLHVFNQELNRSRQFFVSDVIRLITLFPVVDSGPTRPAVCVSPSDSLINTCLQLLLEV